MGGQPPEPVPIGKPGYKFKFPAESADGQNERREHERLRKAERRAEFKASEPPPQLPPVAPSALHPNQAPPGGEAPGLAAQAPALVVEFVPWLGKDISDFTDELIELAEVKRVSDFVQIAREADLPAKLIVEIEKKAHYPTKSKDTLKRTLAECAAKWLNKTGVSAANKEEVKLLFAVVTVKLQGARLKRDLLEMIELDRARQAKAATPANPAQPIVLPDPPSPPGAPKTVIA